MIFDCGSSSLTASGISWISRGMAVTMTVTMAVTMAMSVTSIESRIGFIYPGLETFDHISDVFDLFELFFESVNLGYDASHSGNLCVGVCYHVASSVISGLNRGFCSVLQLTPSC